MRIRKLILKNFRSYKDFSIKFTENLNVIIGKNDAGKSTLLEALEIFFNNDIVKIDISDLNVRASEKVISIGIAFEIDNKKKYLIDSSTKTFLSNEYLLNSEGLLEIHKVWDCSKDKITASCQTSLLKANYLQVFRDNPLITFKIADLRKELKKYENLIPNYETVNKSTSSSIRQAIYECITDKSFVLMDIPLDKEDGKKFFDNLNKEEFPLYFLFQTDRANKDTDKEVQDPLKTITKKAISEVEEQLNAVKKQIEKNAIEMGEKTLQKLKEMAPEIASVLKPNISNKAWDSLFAFSFDCDDGIPINKRGSGVRRLILLNYFRAEAERQNTSNRTIIYGIEEPETSQHPDHQIMLINALKELSNNDKHQVILSTHTPEIAKMIDSSSLFLLDKNENIIRLVEGDEKLLKIADTLGLLPYYSKVVICVEGENDINFLLNINQTIDEYKTIIDIEKQKISLIPMIGSNLKNWINRHYLKDTNVIEFHLYDQDKNRQYERDVKQVNNRQDKSCGLLTQKLEMENYIHYSLIENHFQIKCEEIIKRNWDNEDIPKYIKTKCTKYKDDDIKRIINGLLVKQMTKEYLKELNAFDEIKGWFEKIKELYFN